MVQCLHPGWILIEDLPSLVKSYFSESGSLCLHGRSPPCNMSDRSGDTPQVGARLVDLAMQTLKVRQRNRETGIWETVPLLEHHMINDDSLASLRIPRVTGMVRIHDSVVNQIVQLTDVRPHKLI